MHLLGGGAIQNRLVLCEKSNLPLDELVKINQYLDSI